MSAARPKVLVATPFTYPDKGGVENFSWEVSRGLRRIGWDVTIATVAREGRNLQSEFPQVEFPAVATVASTPIGPWSKQFRSVIADERPDIVWGHLPVPLFADLAARAAKKLRVPFALMYHNDVVTGGIYAPLSQAYTRTLLRGTLATAKSVIVTSEAYGKSSPWLRRVQSKLDVVPCGRKEFPKVRISPAGARGRVLLFVGRLHPLARHKGLEYLLHAMRSLRDIGAELRVVGDGPDRAHYESLARQLGVANQVRFLGSVDDADLAKEYASARVFLLPSTSRAEGFGIVLLEAASHSTPVVASAVGGIPGAMIAGRTGFTVRPRDPAAIVNTVRQLLTDDALATQMGAAGQVFAEPLTWDHAARLTDGILRRLTSCE